MIQDWLFRWLDSNACFSDWYRKSCRDRSECKCPQCRGSVSSVSRNHTLRSLVEVLSLSLHIQTIRGKPNWLEMLISIFCVYVWGHLELEQIVRHLFRSNLRVVQIYWIESKRSLTQEVEFHFTLPKELLWRVLSLFMGMPWDDVDYCRRSVLQDLLKEDPSLGRSPEDVEELEKTALFKGGAESQVGECTSPWPVCVVKLLGLLPETGEISVDLGVHKRFCCC